MAEKRKVQGGKKIDTWVKTVDGLDVLIDVYMSKAPERSWIGGAPKEGTLIFTALQENYNLREEDTDINVLRERMEKLVVERVQVKWDRMILVTVTGDRAPLDDRGWYNPELGTGGEYTKDPDQRSLFGYGSSLTGSRALKLHLEVVECGLIGGVKKHRTYTRHESRRGDYPLKDGWPEVGVFLAGNPHVARVNKAPEKVVALIPDTKENRDALRSIFDAMEALIARLDALLNHDQIQETLTKVLSSGMRMLPSETQS